MKLQADEELNYSAGACQVLLSSLKIAPDDDYRVARTVPKSSIYNFVRVRDGETPYFRFTYCGRRIEAVVTMVESEQVAPKAYTASRFSSEEAKALDRLSRVAAEVADGVRGELGDSIASDIHLVRRMMTEPSPEPSPEETHVGAEPEEQPAPEPEPQSK